MLIKHYRFFLMRFLLFIGYPCDQNLTNYNCCGCCAVGLRVGDAGIKRRRDCPAQMGSCFLFKNPVMLYLIADKKQRDVHKQLDEYLVNSDEIK